MNNIWFYDRYGVPQIILNERGGFVDRHGNNLGYIRNNNVIYNYSGQHCGWIEGYVIRDLHGQVVAFSKLSNDFPSPIFPIPQIPPIPSIPRIPPIPSIPNIPYIKPIKTFGWSPITPVALFK
jgi:hypothetical protein